MQKQGKEIASAWHTPCAPYAVHRRSIFAGIVSSKERRRLQQPFQVSDVPDAQHRAPSLRRPGLCDRHLPAL